MTDSTLILPVAKSEPAPGSIVLLEGPTGTAFQRLFSTDRWHSVIQGMSLSFSWAELQKRAGRPGAYPILLVLDGKAAALAKITGDEVDGQQGLPLGLAGASDLAGATEAQRQEIAQLVQRTGAPVDVNAPRSRAEAAGLLLTLRAFAAERQ